MSVAARLRTAATLPERRPRLFVVFGLVAIAAMSALLALLLIPSGAYPFGEQALSHIYRSEELLRQFAKGNWWPLLDLGQYNGVQPLRHAAPVPIYLYAAFVALAGDGLHAMVPFCVFLFAACCASWLAIGMSYRRGWLGLALGPIWFASPVNLAALFGDGDLPRAICLCVLPLLLALIDRYLARPRRLRIAATAMVFLLVILSDPTFALLVAFGILVYLVVAGVLRHCWGGCLRMALTLLAAAALSGIWVVPALVGGASVLDTPQLLANVTQALTAMLDPLERYTSGVEAAYLGVSVAALAVFGAVCARRASLPGFWAAMVAVFISTTAAAPLVSFVTGSADIGIARMLGVAVALVLVAFISWRSLKTGFVLAACVVLAIDGAASARVVIDSFGRSDPAVRMASHLDRALIAKAKSICTQRLGLVGEDFFDEESAYLAVGLGDRTSLTQGFSDQLSETDYNYTQVNQALEDGRFAYVFDRSLELGDDTIVLNTGQISARVSWTAKQIDAAAQRSGYSFVEAKDGYRLYHRDAPATFGVKTAYRAIAIGRAASEIARQFPAFEEAPDRALDSYSYDDLKGYDTVYLDGFTCKSRRAAEKLVERLSDSGVDVIIAADGIPTEEHTGEKTFLGLDCESITFQGGFPTIYTEGGPLETTLFPNGYTDWSCVYVNGLVDVYATIREGDRTLPVCGTLENSHIKVIGLNLTYYEGLTGDEGMAGLLSRFLDISSQELPSRETLPISIDVSGNTLTVESEAGSVDTTLAALECMDVKSGTSWTAENLVYVGRGKTVIELGYPYLWQGAMVSVLGLLGLIVLLDPRGSKLFQKSC